MKDGGVYTRAVLGTTHALNHRTILLQPRPRPSSSRRRAASPIRHQSQCSKTRAGQTLSLPCDIYYFFAFFFLFFFAACFFAQVSVYRKAVVKANVRTGDGSEGGGGKVSVGASPNCNNVHHRGNGRPNLFLVTRSASFLVEEKLVTNFAILYCFWFWWTSRK